MAVVVFAISVLMVAVRVIFVVLVVVPAVTVRVRLRLRARVLAVAVLVVAVRVVLAAAKKPTSRKHQKIHDQASARARACEKTRPRTAAEIDETVALRINMLWVWTPVRYVAGYQIAANFTETAEDIGCIGDERMRKPHLCMKERVHSQERAA